MRTRLTGLWRSPDFVRLWIGGTVSEFGSQITFWALPLTAVLLLDASPLQIGILAAVGSMPALLFGLGVGVWVDRRKKRPLMIAADYGRGLLLLTVPIAAAFHILRIEHLYAVAIGVGTLTLLFGVANRSMLPSLVDREELVEANSKLSIGYSISQVTGPGVGGVLVQLFTAPAALIVDAATYVVSALSIGSIRAQEPEPSRSAQGTDFVRDARAGVGLILRNPVLIAIAGAVAGLTIFNAVFEAVFVLYVIRTLGISPFTFGLAMSAGSVGFLVGASLADRFIRWAGPGRAMVIGVVILGLSDLAIPLASGPVVAVVALIGCAQFMFGVGIVAYSVSQVSITQAITPIRLQGRINGIMHSLAIGLVPIGALIGGVIGQTIGVRPTLFLAAGGEIAAVMWLLLTPVWSLRNLPEPSDDSNGPTKPQNR